jgi:signal transduction histidine kinase
MTRIESGTLILKNELIPVNLIIDDCLESFKFQEDFSRISVKNEVSDAMIYADKILVTQAIVNLIDNALKYSPEAKQVFITTTKTNDGPVSVSIRDYGSGINPDLDLDYINLFSKNHSGGRGGLGLAIAFNFIKSTGGTIKLNKEIKDGTEFEITLKSKPQGV